MPDSIIEDYALIGDCRTAALVAKNGSIDWWSPRRFDMGACFAALLGTEDNGRWQLAPTQKVLEVRREYVPDTMVLQTYYRTETGEVTLIDFMPFGETATERSQLVRVVKCTAGRVQMGFDLVIRFDYGSRVPWVTSQHGVLQAIAGPDMLRLHCPVALKGRNMRTVSQFEVEAGHSVPFVLCYAKSHLAAPRPVDPAWAFDSTCDAWREWSKHSTYNGRHREAVQRSLLTMKALTYAPTGGIVAAPTTSLPEAIGGERNWDYRYCWLRDATITLYSLLVAGYTEEAKAWRAWLLRAVAGTSGHPQAIYGIAGEQRLPEMEIPWLEGYAGSKPVRIGNGAYGQLQLDTYGELMDAMYQCRHAGLEDGASWALERKLIEHLEKAWHEPDEGIWEVRGPKQHFTHSKVMAWVAFDRAVRSCEQFGREGPVERWKQVRDEIHADVCAKGYSEKHGSFMQAYGSNELDASLLMLPLVGFLPADDARVKGTIEAVERELLIDDTFVLRYRSASGVDGLPAGEGAFLACSFWLVSNRVMQGRLDEANALFERLLALQNDVGLLAEEYDPKAKHFLGNFPQAFSHLALVDAAVSLSDVARNPADHRIAPLRVDPMPTP